MKNLLISILVGTLLAGCAPAPQPAPAVPATPVVPASAHSGGSVTGNNKIIVNPPHMPVAPIQGAPGALAQGWQTFTSSSLQIAVDTPGDWSAKEDADRVTFTSPQGQTVLLKRGNGNSAPAPSSQSCATVVTSYGLTVNACFDATTSQYSALFSGVGSTTWIMLSTVSHETLPVYLQMFDTLRPLQ